MNYQTYKPHKDLESTVKFYWTLEVPFDPKNKKQKIRKLKNRQQTREDLTRKGLAQLLMSFLETLNSKSCSLKSL